MKKDFKIHTFALSAVAAIAIISPFSMTARKYAIKAYGDIGLGSAMSLTPDLPGMTSKSSSNSFGLDFGYTFWQKKGNSLEANVGVGYRSASATFNLPEFSYSYAAPASADDDGNPYQRFTTLNDVEQKINLGYFNIPIYLQYQYRPVKWLGIHADLGVGLGFKCSGKAGSTSGSAYSYGVYPEYDNLMIDAAYLNAFGETSLEESESSSPDLNGFSASMVGGIGCEFYIGGPVSIDLGIRYGVGLTNVFDNQYTVSSSSGVTSENAPVTYTAAHGQQVKALSDYVSKSTLNPLSLHIGINFKF